MQGYITIATGSADYVNMARRLALSIRLNDPERPISLLTDEDTDLDYVTEGLFHSVIRMPHKPGYLGCLNKLRVHEFTPFEETMFIDSDCLVVKEDMDRHWNRLSEFDVNLAGDKQVSGKWYEFDIATVIAQLDINYMVKMNSGVFYFKAGAPSAEFFDTCMRLVTDRRQLLACSHRHPEQIADEPFIGAALGIFGIEPIGYDPEEGSLMITTVGARRCRFDVLDCTSYIEKPTRMRILNRFWAESWVKHSPSIAHFVRLKPEKVYRTACLRLEKHFSDIRFE